ncbi:uncharacterized protein LOC125572426 [Nematostella vectensis]|uniref:uncharacterized protein LOC125572426 n=1 Tax=Nematostella vectensis TaxID=45351 RepID=UPI0020778363|nr:uncharacterized protein LOC125572426 [Nematostella vectensis]
MISKRQKCLSLFGKDSQQFRYWRNKVQVHIKDCKQRFYNAKVATLKQSNPGRWWREVKSLSGMSRNDNQWFNQLIDGTNIVTIQQLCENINTFFTGLTSEFAPLSTNDVDAISVTEIPDDLFVIPREATAALRSIKLRKALGPDGIPNKVWSLVAFELATVVAELYNSSLRQGRIPWLLKCAAVNPIPKERPASVIENHIRPISLT